MLVLLKNKAQLSPGSPSPFLLFQIVPLAELNQPQAGLREVWPGRQEPVHEN